jgi:hypothetical protein
MRFLVLCISCGMILCLSSPGMAGQSGPDRHLAELEIRRDFEAALDLWRDGRYEELYLRTYASGRVSRESVLQRLAAAGRRPACCWKKLQEVEITAGTGNTATLQARIGLEDRLGVIEHSTRSFRLVRQDGLWKPAMADILSLAGRAAVKSSTYRQP